MSEGMIIRRGGSGGTAFTIKTYPSSFPASAKEGTIGILTSVAYPSIVISALEPDTPVDGMIWIQVGTVSAYPVTVGKKQIITICPLKVQQYVSGSWTQRTAKTYLEGAWHDWMWVLINGTVSYGMEKCDRSWSNTGGFPDVSSDDGSVLVSIYNHSGSFVSSNAIDLTPYSKLKFTYKKASSSGTEDQGARLGYSNAAKGAFASYLNLSNKSAYTDVEMDVSSVTEPVWIAVGVTSGHSSIANKVWIRSLTLEP